METYIRAIEKLVIKDLVDWKNKEIETAKEVVNNEASCISVGKSTSL